MECLPCIEDESQSKYLRFIYKAFAMVVVELAESDSYPYELLESARRGDSKFK